MNILFVTSSYYPLLSGVPVVVKYLAEGLAAKEHCVSVVTCAHGNPQKAEEVNGVYVYRHDIYQNLLKLPAGRTREYIDFVCNFRADVVIIECTECITCNLLLPHLKRIRGKVILHAHGFSGLCNIKSTPMFAKRDGFLHTIGHPYNWIRSWYYFKCILPKYINDFDASMVLSEADSAKEYLERFLGSKNYVLENAADDMFFVDYSKESNPLHEIIDLKSSRYCLSCANYTVVKNQKDMIREFYKADVKDLALVCIGSSDNPYYKECLQLCNEMEKKYGYREVHLLHHIDRKYIPLIEGHALLYLVSSIWEEYSISIIEAMAQSVPFISTNVGNAKFLPGGVTIEDIHNTHDTIARLVDDKSLYSQLSRKGKEYAYTHCRKAIAVNTLERIIKETVKE
jgi:glycosyltransferase involved in cell wall biosynthesis